MIDETKRKALKVYENTMRSAADIRRASLRAAESTYKETQQKAKEEFDRASVKR
jgi:hypothetical protein